MSDKDHVDQDMSPPKDVTNAGGQSLETELTPACLDCGASLVGPHCHACGQKAQLHHSLGAFWHDLLHGIFHIDGKAWRTLRLLVWSPGELTRRYTKGERTKFISPVALFLFSIFLMFATFQLSGIKSPADVGAPTYDTSAAGATGNAGESFIIGNAKEGTALTVERTGWAWLDHGLGLSVISCAGGHNG